MDRQGNRHRSAKRGLSVQFRQGPPAIEAAARCLRGAGARDRSRQWLRRSLQRLGLRDWSWENLRLPRRRFARPAAAGENYWRRSTTWVWPCTGKAGTRGKRETCAGRLNSSPNRLSAEQSRPGVSGTGPRGGGRGIYRAALTSSSREPTVLTNLGNALIDLSVRGGHRCFREATAIAPGGCGHILQLGERHICARSGSRRRRGNFPTRWREIRNWPKPRKAAVSALHNLGRIEEASRRLRARFCCSPTTATYIPGLLFTLLHSHEVTPRQVFRRAP